MANRIVTANTMKGLARPVNHPLMSVMALGLMLMAACTPTVQVAMPSEPITINLNVRIEHEIRVRVERELDDMFDENSGLF